MNNIKFIDHDISDTVLYMMELASDMQQIEFNEDQIDGGFESICVEEEEDMIVTVCYIAECITFGRPVQLDTVNIELERQKIIDTFVTLLRLSN